MTRQDDVEQLAILVADLVDGFTTRERHEWRPSREHPDYADRAKPLPKTAERRVHETDEPGLLEQLRRGPGRRRAVAKPEPQFVEVMQVEGGPELVHVPTTADAFALIADMAPTPGQASSGGGSRGKPTSRPPAQMHAAETLVELTMDIAETRARIRYAAGLGRGPALSAALMLRDLLDLVLRQQSGGGWLVDDGQVRRLRSAARSWSSRARLALSYDAPVVTLRDRFCADGPGGPGCGGQLRVRADASSDVWCGGLPGRLIVGPARDGDPWPMRDRGCGARWPRISWIDLLQDEPATVSEEAG